jgi:hypothetical protein
VAAILAALDMAAEGGRAALLDRRHDLELTQAHMPGIDPASGGSMAAKEFGDLQPRATHGRRATPRVAAIPSINGASRSSGLVPSNSVPFTWAL